MYLLLYIYISILLLFSIITTIIMESIHTHFHTDEIQIKKSSTLKSSSSSSSCESILGSNIIPQLHSIKRNSTPFNIYVPHPKPKHSEIIPSPLSLKLNTTNNEDDEDTFTLDDFALTNDNDDEFLSDASSEAESPKQQQHPTLTYIKSQMKLQQQMNTQSIWKKHIKKEQADINHNDKVLSILRILEAGANEVSQL